MKKSKKQIENIIEEKNNHIVEIKDPFLKTVLKRIENLIIIAGFPGAGKSTLSLRFANELLKHGKEVYFFDTEHQLAPERLSIISNQFKDKFHYLKVIFFEELVEQILDKINTLTSDELKKIAFIWDSVGGTSIKAEFEALKEMTKNAALIQAGGIALLPRILSYFLRNIVPILDNYNIPFIITNQYRAKIQLNPYAGLPKNFYGEKGEMPGGFSLKHYAYVYLELIKKEQNEKGAWIRIRSLKNKMQPPSEIDYYLDYINGFDENIMTIEFAFQNKLINSSGGWYTWKDKKYRKEELVNLFQRDENEFESLRQLVISNLNEDTLSSNIIIKEE